VLPFGRLWYAEPDAISNAIGYAEFFSRSQTAVIRVYDEAGNVIETHEQAVPRCGKQELSGANYSLAANRSEARWPPPS